MFNKQIMSIGIAVMAALPLSAGISHAMSSADLIARVSTVDSRLADKIMQDAELADLLINDAALLNKLLSNEAMREDLLNGTIKTSDLESASSASFSSNQPVRPAVSPKPALKPRAQAALVARAEESIAEVRSELSEETLRSLDAEGALIAASNAVERGGVQEPVKPGDTKPGTNPHLTSAASDPVKPGDTKPKPGDFGVQEQGSDPVKPPRGDTRPLGPRPDGGGNTTTTTTTTKDCSIVAGVIPGESRRLRVNQRPLATYSFPAVTGWVMPSVNPADLAAYSNDFAGPWMWESGNADRIRLPLMPGEVVSVPFTTREYNTPQWRELSLSSHPGVASGNAWLTITECAGDFTAPEPNCKVNIGPMGSSINFGFSGNNGFICELKPNRQYYLNFTAGFIGDRGAEGDRPVTIIGIGDGPNQSFDVLTRLIPNHHFNSVRNPGFNNIRGLEQLEDALRQAHTNRYNAAMGASSAANAALRNCLASATTPAADRACRSARSAAVCSYVNGNPENCRPGQRPIPQSWGGGGTAPSTGGDGNFIQLGY